MLKVYVSLHHCSIVKDFLCHYQYVMQVQPAVINVYLADFKPYTLAVIVATLCILLEPAYLHKIQFNGSVLTSWLFLYNSFCMCGGILA